MSLYPNKIQVDGVPCGLILRGSANGTYLAVFEREMAELTERMAGDSDPALLRRYDALTAAYEAGGSVVSLFLGPATCALAVNIHRQWRWLRRAWLPVLGGCAAGSLFSVASVYLFCRLLQLEDSLIFSLLPKAVTTPVAMELASLTGGVPAIAVAAVLISGLLGSILAQPLQKALRLEDPVALGVALGTASHAIGTTKALELGEVQGAFSGMAIGISGLFTSLWLALFF